MFLLLSSFLLQTTNYSTLFSLYVFPFVLITTEIHLVRMLNCKVHTVCMYINALINQGE